MLGKIIGFELRYRYSKPMTWIFMAMMVFQAIWYAKGTYDYYVNDATHLNAAGIIYQSLAGGGMLMIIAIAVITGTALFKNREFGTAETFYSYPVKDRTWVAGKFIAAYVVNLSICLMFALGFSLLQYTGLAGPEKFGPVPWGHIFYGFLIFSVPNMFIITMITLSMVIFFRSMASGYLAVFLLTMLFMIAEGTRENAATITTNYLLDPFGYCFTKDAIELLPVTMKNSAYFRLTGIYFANRALWIGIATVVTFFAFRTFSFKYFIARPVKKGGLSAARDDRPYSGNPVLTPEKRFGLFEYVKKLFRLSVLEFKNTVRPVGFRIVFALLTLMFFGYNYLWNAEYYIQTDILPITSAMTFTRLPNGVYMLILLAIFAGELLFKERSSQVWHITDTLPVPTWVTWLSKYLAMGAVAFLFSLTLLIPGLVAQVLQGYFDIEWSVYFNDIFSYHFGWLNYLMVIALAFFLGAVTVNRFTGHILTVAIIFFIVVFSDMGVIEQVRFMFPFTPGIDDYSEMNGYGVYGDAAGWYAVLWGTLALALLLAGLWFWNRGCIQSAAKRFSLKKTQLNVAGKIGIVVLLGAFFSLQHYVVANDHKLGNFKTDNQKQAEDAEYEKLFKYIENENQPLVCGLDMSIDLQPLQRRADYRFTMNAVNGGIGTIDTLYLSLKDFVHLHRLQLDGTVLQPAWHNEKHGQLAFALPQPITVGDTVTLNGTCTLQYVGFSTKDPQRALVYNGSFLEEDIIPRIGYDDDRELSENRHRGSHGLAKLQSRMNPVDDSAARCKEALSPGAVRHKTTIRVHCSGDQTAYASGAFKGTETIQGREYAVYETKFPAAMKWFVGAGRYHTHRAGFVNGTQLRLFYDERHAYNLEHVEAAANDGIRFIEKYLGAYPYSQLSIAEIPFYNDDDFYTAPDAIAISEKHCWTADGKREKDLTYIYYVICREMVAHWVEQNMQVADVQGADMLLVALPEACALYYVKEKFGDDILQIYLDKKRKRYGKGRGNESNTEPPLRYADGAGYLEVNKGALELLDVLQTMDVVQFTGCLTSWLRESAQKKAVFNDFYAELSKHYPADGKASLVEAFETVGE